MTAIGTPSLFFYLLFCEVLLFSLLCRHMLCDLCHEECHCCCVNDGDQNIHGVPPFHFLYLYDLSVFLSDNNIAHNCIYEQLIVVMLDINFLNI